MLSKYSILLKTCGYFHTRMLASTLPQSVKIDIWQAHWLDIVGINLCAKNYQCIPKVSRVVGIFAIIFWLRLCLGQGKVAFGNSFVWILSILMCIQNFIKISHMVEDLRRFPYFHTFCFGVALVKEKLHLASVSARPCRYLSVYQPSRHTALKWRRINVDATWSRRIDVDTTSFWCCVPAGKIFPTV